MTTYYAVNTETKEHIKIPNMRYKPQGVKWKVVEGDDDGWIGFCGDESPLPSNVTCRVCDSDGKPSFISRKASRVEWSEVAEYLPLEIESAGEEQQEWNGKGLPPVGTVCEVIEPDDGEACWTETTVIARSEGIVWLSGNGLQQENRLRFRPIRSAEQRAEDEAVKTMVKIMNDWSSDRARASSLYEAIRDGKIPGIKLDL